MELTMRNRSEANIQQKHKGPYTSLRKTKEELKGNAYMYRGENCVVYSQIKSVWVVRADKFIFISYLYHYIGIYSPNKIIHLHNLLYIYYNC